MTTKVSPPGFLRERGGRYAPYLFHLFACLMFQDCSNPPEERSRISENETKEITSAVINRFNEMIKYSEAGELENVLKYFDAEADGSYIDGGTRYASFQEMADSYRAGWKVLKQDYGIPDTKVVVLSSEFALVTATSVLNTTHSGTVVFRPRPWSITTLWHRKGDQWLVHSLHQFSGDLVPLEPEAEED